MLSDYLTEKGKAELAAMMTEYGDGKAEELFVNTRLQGDETVKDNKPLYAC